MRHLKTFENLIPKPNTHSFDNEVLDIHNNLCDLLLSEMDFSKADDIQRDNIFKYCLRMQGEFDNMDGQLPINYGCLHVAGGAYYLPDMPEPYSVVYEALGIHHAHAIWAIDLGIGEVIFDDDEYRVSEIDEHTTRKNIEYYEQRINVLKNPKKLEL